MGLAMCVRDYVMEDGSIAFRAGKKYSWRYTSEAELAEIGAEFVFSSETGDCHFMDFADVQEAFGEGDFKD